MYIINSKMKKAKLFSFALFIALEHTLFHRVQCGNRSDAEDLYKHLFTGYSKDIRPTYEKVVEVSIGMYLFSINDFDEISGTFSAVGGFYCLWQDSRLEWVEQDFSNLSGMVVPAANVWYPDIFLINPAKKMVAIGDTRFITRLWSSGYVLRFIGSLIRTTCSVNMAYFPYDEQVCYISVSAWGYDPDSEVRLKALRPVVDLFYYQENAQWKIMKTDLKPFKMNTIDGMVSGTIYLRRKSEYFALNLLAPIFLLCFLNPFVFILPPESGERVSYTVTIFLSLAVFMTLFSDNMPKSSEPLPKLTYFLIIAMIYSTLMCVTTILGLKMYFNHGNKPVPKWLHRIIKVLNCRWFCRCQLRAVNKVPHDKIETEVARESTDEKDRSDSEDTDWKRVAAAVDRIAFVYSLVLMFFLVALVMLSYNI